MATAMANVERLTREEVDHNHQVTLVVPSTGDATRLSEFKDKVKQTFVHRALGVIGSWTETLITVEIDEAISTADLVDKLVNMPEVEKAEKKQIKNHNARQEGILVTLAT